MLAPGATPEVARQLARLFMCAVEKKQKSVVASELKDELSQGAEMMPLFDI